MTSPLTSVVVHRRKSKRIIHTYAQIQFWVCQASYQIIGKMHAYYAANWHFLSGIAPGRTLEVDRCWDWGDDDR